MKPRTGPANTFAARVRAGALGGVFFRLGRLGATRVVFFLLFLGLAVLFFETLRFVAFLLFFFADVFFPLAFFLLTVRFATFFFDPFLTGVFLAEAPLLVVAFFFFFFLPDAALDLSACFPDVFLEIFFREDFFAEVPAGFLRAAFFGVFLRLTFARFFVTAFFAGIDQASKTVETKPAIIHAPCAGGSVRSPIFSPNPAPAGTVSGAANRGHGARRPRWCRSRPER